MGSEHWRLLPLFGAPQRPGSPLVPQAPLFQGEGAPEEGTGVPSRRRLRVLNLMVLRATVGLRQPFLPHRHGDRVSERQCRSYQVRAGWDLNPGSASPMLGAGPPTGVHQGSPGQCWLWD